MPKQSVTAFRAQIAAEPELADEVRRIMAAGSRSEALMTLARSRGFEFTPAEADESLSEGELSELELELIAGGASGTTSGSFGGHQEGSY